MNHISKILICFLFFVSTAHAEEATMAKTITIAADVWCPINCDPADDNLGVGIDLAKRIFEPLGYKINYVILPWARALEDARQGKIDAVVGANTSDDPTLVFPSSPISSIDDGFFALAKSPIEYTGLDSLKKYKIGTIKDYGYSEAINAFLDEQRKTPGGVQEVSGETGLEQNIKKLQAGRIDVLIESTMIMSYSLKKMGLTNEIRQIGTVPQGYVYLAFSPAKEESKNLAKTFDEALAQLKASGALQVVYAYYNMSPPDSAP